MPPPTDRCGHPPFDSLPPVLGTPFQCQVEIRSPGSRKETATRSRAHWPSSLGPSAQFRQCCGGGCSRGNFFVFVLEELVLTGQPKDTNSFDGVTILGRPMLMFQRDSRRNQPFRRGCGPPWCHIPKVLQQANFEGSLEKGHVVIHRGSGRKIWVCLL